MNIRDIRWWGLKSKIAFAVVFAVGLTSLSVLAHESVHVVQCWKENGSASWGFTWHASYDFLNLSGFPAGPSPTTFCRWVGIQKQKRHGDLYYELPAYMVSLIVICAGLVILKLVIRKQDEFDVWDSANGIAS